MYIYTYIYIFKQMPIFYVLLKYMIKKHMIYVKVPIFCSIQKFYQCEIKLQTKIQINQQQSKLKNTSRIKEIIAKGKIKIMSLQKEILRRINLTNTVQMSHQRH